MYAACTDICVKPVAYPASVRRFLEIAARAQIKHYH